MPRALPLAARLAAPALVFGLVVLLAPRPAAAQADDARPVRLTVRAKGCTTDSAFFQLLARKTARVRRANPGEPSAVVDIEIARDGNQSIGKLRLSPLGDASATASAGATPARTVRGDSCDEIVATLALMAAIAIDPDASGKGDVAKAPAPAPTPPPQAPPRAPAAAVPVRDQSARTRLSAGVLGAVALEGAAGAAWELGGYVALERFAEGRPLSAWLPSVRVAGAYRHVAIDASGAVGSAVWKVAQIDVCPWRLDVGGDVTLRPCVLVEGGALSASLDSGVVQARPITRPWIAPGAGARLTWDRLDPLVVGLEAIVAFPAYRDVFRIDPDIAVFRAPPAIARFGLTLGIIFL